MTDEAAIIGESLAGLFVLATCTTEPGLFRTCIAIDPSLWWNDGGLVRTTREGPVATPRILYVATSDEAGIIELAKEFVDVTASRASPGSEVVYDPMAEETHATVYHPAAMRALRRLFKPSEGGA